MEGLEVFCRSSCSIVENNHLAASFERKSPRAARRRRMEIRRFKLMATSEPPSSNKRMKLADSNVFGRDCMNAVDSSATAVAQVNDQTEAKNSKSEEKVQGLKENVMTDEVCTSGSSPSEEFECPEYGVASVCGRRREMEDAVSIMPGLKSSKNSSALHFFGVYDGHGGFQAAAFCKDRLHEILAEELNSCGGMQTESDWQKAMSGCFNRVDAEVLYGGTCKKDCKTEGKTECLCEQTISSETVGTTAVVGVVGSRQIVVANCGDSRAVLSRNGVAIPLSADHKPDRQDEMLRIESAGGRVIFWNGPRVLGVLAMSRAIGDKYLKPYVISEPEVTVTDRTDADECLVLASDGLWDVLSNEFVCEVARKCLSGRLPGAAARALSNDGDVEESPSAAAAALLTKLALARGSIDNISVVVVDLKKGYRHRR